MSIKTILWTAVGLAVVGVAGLAIFAHQSEIAAVSRPDPGSFDKALVERGRVLANFGDCTACHTRPDGQAFAGNFPLKTPFGTIYTTNITPDPDTGIGTWSKDAFRRAMKDGVDRKGNHLYPAFPYDHFTKVRDADIDAIYAFLMTQAPVKEATKGNDFPFPLNIRATLSVWKALFLDKTPIATDSSKDAQWNDGAYLVEGLGHCGACHTPRNFMGAETKPTYGGGFAEGWYAPPLNKDNLSQLPWTQNELVVYLMDGWHAKHGMAAGPMTPVVDALHKQNEIDVFAIASYVATLRTGEKPINEDAVKTAAAKLDWGHPDAPPVPKDFADGAKVFQARCAQCHNSSGGTVSLALQTSLHAPTADTVAHAIWSGIRPPTGALGKSMPALGQQMTEAEMVSVVKFLRARYTSRPAWSGVEKAVKEARQAPTLAP
ncbi:MAG: c-type cytochrome [Rhodospirillales bacterium]|jgi:mono/diheme cytochrome c family protein|nr:c-type cytochrome [Rhodospirillales bacterium]